MISKAAGFRRVTFAYINSEIDFQIFKQIRKPKGRKGASGFFSEFPLQGSDQNN